MGIEAFKSWEEITPEKAPEKKGSLESFQEWQEPTEPSAPAEAPSLLDQVVSAVAAKLQPTSESREKAIAETEAEAKQRKELPIDPSTVMNPTIEMKPTTGGITPVEDLPYDQKIQHYRELETVLLSQTPDPEERTKIRAGVDSLVLNILNQQQALEEPWIDPTFAASAGGGMGARLGVRTADGVISTILAAVRGGVTGAAGAAFGEMVSAPFVERVNTPAGKYAMNILLGGLAEQTSQALFFKLVKKAPPEEISKAATSLKDALRAEARRPELPKTEAQKLEGLAERADEVAAIAEKEIVPPSPVPSAPTPKEGPIGKLGMEATTLPKTPETPPSITQLAKESVTPPKKEWQKDAVEKLRDRLAKKADTSSTTLSSLGAGEAEKAFETSKNVMRWWSDGPGKRVWDFFSSDLPERAGSKNEAVENFNYWFFTDYKRKDFAEDLRGVDRKAAKMQMHAIDLGKELMKFSSAEQKRAAQIIRGSITNAPKRYEKAIYAAQEFKRLKEELTELRVFSKDTIFDALPRKERSKYLRQIYGGQAPKSEGGKYVTGLNDKIDVIERKLSGSPWTYKATGDARANLKKRLRTLKEERGKAWAKLARHYPLKVRGAQLTDKQLKQIGINRTTEENLDRLIFHPPVPAGKQYLTQAYLKYEGQAFEENPILKAVFPFRRPGLKRWYTRRRKFLTAEERKGLGLIEEAPYPVAKGLSAQYHDLEMAQFFKRVSENPEYATKNLDEAVEKGWQLYQLKGPRYGMLDGSYVAPGVYKDLAWMRRFTTTEFARKLDKYLGMWKFMKVGADPGAQFRNLFSNTILADFGDVPHWDMKTYTETLYDFARKGTHYQEAIEHNLFGKEWANVEMSRFLDIDSALKEGDITNGIDVAMEFVRRVSDTLTDVYQANEQFFKLLVYKKARAQGASIDQAIDKAQHHIFDYSAIPPIVQIAKRFYSPFITFTWKALPVVAETAIRKPWKIAKYMMLYEGLKTHAIDKFGWTEEEADAKFASLPEYMTKLLPGAGESHWLMPWGSYTDDDGELHAKMLDMNYIFPGTGDITETWGQSGLPLRPLFPNHPVLDILIAANTQVAPFSGIAITTEYEQTHKKDRLKQFLKTGDIGYLSYWTKNARFIADTLFPSLTPFVGRSYNEIVSALQHKKDLFGNEKTLPNALVDVFFGLHFRDVAFSQERAKRVLDNMGMYQEIRKEARREIRDIRSRTFDSDPVKDDEIKQEKIKKLMEMTKSDLNNLKEETLEMKPKKVPPFMPVQTP